MPTSLVVKKGSKTRPMSSAGMPAPVSATRRATKSPAMPSASPSFTVTLSAEMVRLPPSLMASRALTARLSSASSNSLISTATGHVPGATRSAIAISPRRLDCRMPSTAGSRSARSITTVSCVCRREKDRSWRVREAPRLTAMSMASSAPAGVRRRRRSGAGARHCRSPPSGDC